MSALLQLLVVGQSSTRYRHRGTLPTALWVLIGIAAAVWTVFAIVLQIALWYPYSGLARCIVAMRIPGASRSIEQRRARYSHPNPVTGILMTTPVPQGPIAVGQAIPTNEDVPTATAVAVPT